jgi:hypothetical protein
MVVYIDLTHSQMLHPIVFINRRASLLTGRRIYSDCVVIPEFLGTHLYHLLRMEFVASYRGPQSTPDSPHVPLSSDAFTFFGRHNALEHNLEVKQATNQLLSIRIKEVADQLLSQASSRAELEADLNVVSSSQLVRLLHSRGINMRHLGKLRSLIFSNIGTTTTATKSSNVSLVQTRERISALILTEMIARVFKSSIRAKLRQLERPELNCFAEIASNPTQFAEMKRQHTNQLLLSMKQLIVQDLNEILGPHRMIPAIKPKSEDPWAVAQYEFLQSQYDGLLWNDTLKTRIQLKFGLHTPALSPAELKPGYDLGSNMLRLSLLLNLSSNLGVKLTPAALLRFQGGDAAFLSKVDPFSVDDLESIEVEVNGNAAEQEDERARLFQAVKTGALRFETSIDGAALLGRPETTSSPDLYQSVLTVLSWFKFPGLAAPGARHPLLELDQSSVLHQRIRVESRTIDALVQLFGLSELPPEGTKQPAVHCEIRSTLIELARLFSKLATEVQVQDGYQREKSELREHRRVEEIVELLFHVKLSAVSVLF